MSPAITMTGAITVMVAEKRATGYKYDAEHQVLARFEAFCASQFPGWRRPPDLGGSVDRGRAAARSQARDPAGPGRAGQGAGPLAGPPGRGGLPAARRGTAQARPVCPAHLHRPGTGGAVRADRPLPLRSQVPLRHLVMPVLFRTIYACGLRCLRSPPAALRRRRHRRRGAAQSATRKAAKTGRCPSARRCEPGSPAITPRSPGSRAGGDWFFPGRPGPAAHARQRRTKLPPVLVAGPHLPRRPRPRPPGPRSAPYFRGQQSAVWFAQGQDVGALLPVLQTYMGHSSLADTAYYLHLTAESYPDITARVQQAIGDVVPPVMAGPRHGH